MTTALYPLRFEPLLRRYLWGGRRLETVLGKTLGAGDDYAESWEICDRYQDQSVVVSGPLRGTTLGELVVGRGAELLGRHHPQPRFPLLLKYLDCRQRLSVQVHPNDAQAARLDPPDLGKTEAWLILDAVPGSVIYAGLKRGCDRETIQRELARGTCECCLHRFEPRVGDCIFLPAGTVHALGEGLLVAEIQQASDTTYRLFDWNRLGPDGRPRTLHIQQALDVIDYAQGPVQPQAPQATDRDHVSRLVACDMFVLDRWQLDTPQPVENSDRCTILTLLGGQVHVPAEPDPQPLRTGDTMFLPASLGAVELVPQGRAVLLAAYLP